jgi:pimeloyl-ACP methyl ester carboxylesterase
VEVIVRKTRIRIEAAGRRNGDRPSLVLVHGAGGDASLWAPQERRFREEIRVLRVELPGHGGSGGRGETGIVEYAGWVEEAVRGAVGPEGYVLGGHSMGGAVALQMAVNGSEGLEALVLVATGARLGVAPVIFRLIREDFEGFVQTIDRAALGPDASPEVRDAVAGALRQCSPEVVHGDFTACDRFDLRDRLGEVSVPALVICGEEDRLTPLSLSESLAKGTPGGRLLRVPGAGHLVMMEKPEEVNEGMAAFFRETNLFSLHPLRQG